MNIIRFSLLFALTMTSCVLADTIRLTEADNGRTNSANVGGEIEIVLKGNPTTGYSWEMASFSTNSLQQIGAGQYRQTEQSAGRPRVGVGGQFLFKFKAVKPGESDIKMVYRRSWETTSCDKVYSVVIDVK